MAMTTTRKWLTVSVAFVVFAAWVAGVWFAVDLWFV